jgi:uncharacterized protein YutE (UPF0331/DUF86 family)
MPAPSMSEFACRFRSIAGFRNVLVHGYLGVDLARLHQMLNAGLDDLAAFARTISVVSSAPRAKSGRISPASSRYWSD